MWGGEGGMCGKGRGGMCGEVREVCGKVRGGVYGEVRGVYVGSERRVVWRGREVVWRGEKSEEGEYIYPCSSLCVDI